MSIESGQEFLIDSRFSLDFNEALQTNGINFGATCKHRIWDSEQ